MIRGRVTAMKDATQTTMDAAGRLVIPKPIRQRAGLKPGQPLDVSLHDGRVEIEPAPVPVRIEKRGRVAVAVPEEPLPPLTSEEVEATRHQLRHRHDSE